MIASNDYFEIDLKISEKLSIDAVSCGVPELMSEKLPKGQCRYCIIVILITQRHSTIA